MHSDRSLRLAALVSVFAAGGCISSSGTLQTAHVRPQGDWQVTAGATVPVPTRFVQEIKNLIDQATEQLGDGTEVTEEEQRDAIVSVMGILLFQPTLVTPLSVRRGFGYGVDIGIRYAGPAIRFDGKWQFAVTEDNVAVSLNAGYTHHTGIGASVASSLYDVFDSLKLVSYSRRDLDVNLLASTDPQRRLSFFGAARYVAAFTSFDTELDQELLGDTFRGVQDTSAVMHLFGGSAGLRLGAERFALLAEFTLMRVLFEPEVLGAPADLGGWIIEPGVGLSFNF